jgi:hypothetical protein
MAWSANFVASGFSRKLVRDSAFRLTSLRQGYGGPPKRFARRRKAEATQSVLRNTFYRIKSNNREYFTTNDRSVRSGRSKSS